MKSLEGREAAERLRQATKERVDRLRARGVTPTLAVLVATESQAARAYLEAKRKLGDRLGIRVVVRAVRSPTTETVLAELARLADDFAVSGILIETPLPGSIDTRSLMDAIPVGKDVDGASTASLGRLFAGDPLFVPATAEAVVRLLDAHEVPVEGRHAVVVGRSLVVGRPLAQLLLARHATVTVCHSRSGNLAAYLRGADIVCAAVGRPGLITGEMLGRGCVVVDIGTNSVDGRLVGDVDASSAAAVVQALSPVPGGVGPLTTSVLMEHVVRAAELQEAG